MEWAVCGAGRKPDDVRPIVRLLLGGLRRFSVVSVPESGTRLTENGLSSSW